MVVKASSDWIYSDSDDVFIARCQAAIDGVTDNPYFTNIVPTAQDAATSLSALRTARAAATNGGKIQTENKNAKRADMANTMKKWAAYITLTANGDMTHLLSSRFPYQKPVREKVGTLSQPSLKAKQGKKSGEIAGSTAPVYGASSYSWRIALAAEPETFVQTAQTPGGRYTFQGLTLGQTYLVQVCAIGASGPSDWSLAVPVIVI